MDTKYEERGYLTEDFRLFHLKDHPHDSIDWHYHTFHKIILFLAGEGSYAIEGKEYPLRPGDVILVPRGCVHRPQLAPMPEYERYILYISPEYLRKLGEGRCDLETCFHRAEREFCFVSRPREKHTDVLRQFARLEEAPVDEAFGSDMLAETALVRLVITLTRAMEQTPSGEKERCYADPGILAILQYLSRHLTEPITVDALARRFHVSKYHMMRKFKQATGHTIHSYLSSKRLILARELITEGTGAMSACTQCGFQDYSAFSRAYKKLFGVSPRKTL